MSDIAIEFAGKTDRFKRDLREIERDAERTARSIERSFRDAEIRGFKTDPGVMRTQRLAVEREVNQRIGEDRRASNQRWIADETAAQSRMARRTGVYTDQRAREWAEAEANRGRASARANRLATFGLSAVIASLGAANKMADEYNSKWGDATGGAGRFQAAVSQMKTKIGQDLAGVKDAFGPVIGAIERARSGLVGLIANAIRLDSMHSIRVDSAHESLRRVETEKAQTASFHRQKRELEAANAEAGGDTAGARAIRERLDYEDFVTANNAKVAAGEISGGQASELAALRRGRVFRDPVDTVGRARADKQALLDVAERNLGATTTGLRARGEGYSADRHEAVVRAEIEKERLGEDLSPERRAQMTGAINAERDARVAQINAEQAAAQQAHAEERAAALEMYRIRGEEARADDLSARGKSREAEALRETLRLTREIADIRRDDRLTEEDRAALIAQAEARSVANQDRIGKSRLGYTTRTISSGLADRVHLGQALGPGGRDNAAEEQLKETKEQTELLRQIRDGSGVYA